MNEIIIRIILEKGGEFKIVPETQHPIQYNPIDIKRKYYKKTDKEYHRRPIKRVLKTSKFDKVVKQEPLLDFHWEYSIQF